MPCVDLDSALQQLPPFRHLETLHKTAAAVSSQERPTSRWWRTRLQRHLRFPHHLRQCGRVVRPTASYSQSPDRFPPRETHLFRPSRPWAWAGWRLDLRGARHFYISYLANTPTAALPVCAYCSALSHRIQYHRKLRHGPPRLSRASWRGAPASASARARTALRRRKGPPPAVLQNSEIDLFTHTSSPFASRPQTHSHGAPFGGALRAR